MDYGEGWERFQNEAQPALRHKEDSRATPILWSRTGRAGRERRKPGVGPGFLVGYGAGLTARGAGRR